MSASDDELVLLYGTRWGRSVDAIPGPDGAIYVTDGAAGLVYRLTPAG
ncbi:hypothetical protein NIE79_004648 [Micromonospora sp. NIE79]|uniref:Gluconolaconase n=1 Tax=Micromonospora trifolii TaxID=2911208 RepID=A0ABS9N8P9_9ACTN|nr:hypothetical protein [Micromonospora trifolii]MCG5446083.1 hypothetical protein [Micromonospora trifolii]